MILSEYRTAPLLYATTSSVLPTRTEHSPYCTLLGWGNATHPHRRSRVMGSSDGIALARPAAPRRSVLSAALAPPTERGHFLSHRNTASSQPDFT